MTLLYWRVTVFMRPQQLSIWVLRSKESKYILQSNAIFLGNGKINVFFKMCSFAPYKAKHDRMTLLKCKTGNKKHRVQYEIRTWYRFMEFAKLTESTADTYLEYIQRNLPEGVFMKVTKVGLWTLYESTIFQVLSWHFIF